MKNTKSQNMTMIVDANKEKAVGSVMENLTLGFVLFIGGAIATLASEFIFVGAIVIGAVIICKGLLAKSFR